MSEAAQAAPPRFVKVFCKTTVAAAVESATEREGFKLRTPAGPYTGWILEDFTKDGDAESYLQPTGETVQFVTYWTGQISAFRVIELFQNDRGKFEVIGGECDQ